MPDEIREHDEAIVNNARDITEHHAVCSHTGYNLLGVTVRLSDGRCVAVTDAMVPGSDRALIADRLAVMKSALLAKAKGEA